MIHRRAFITLLGSAAAGWPLGAIPSEAVTPSTCPREEGRMVLVLSIVGG
jgi:hypothetical protein